MTQEPDALPPVRAAWRFGDRLVLERRADLAVIRFACPAPGNLMDRAFFDAVEETLAALDGMSECRGALWTGSGRVFSLGADPAYIKTLDQPGAFALAERIQGFGRRLAGHPFPHVACINGPALGGGLELAMWLDYRLASETTSLGLPEIRHGIMPGGGGVYHLSRHLGPSRALALVLSGQTLAAEDALALGLVQQLAPTRKLLARAVAWLGTLPNAPIAIRAIKQAARHVDAAALDEEAHAFASCFEAPSVMGEMERHIPRALPSVDALAAPRPD